MSQHLCSSPDRYSFLKKTLIFSFVIMASNGWLQRIKDQAQTVQGSAKKSLVKFTDSLDKKLKEAQDDLEKCTDLFLLDLNKIWCFMFWRQRLKAESTRLEVVQQNIWRPSVETPDGAILTVTKSVPHAQFLIDYAH